VYFFDSMYQIPELLKFPKLFHAFSTKADGNMANSILGKVQDFSVVVPNRKRFLTKLDVSVDETVCMWVVHKDEVVIADKKWSGRSILDSNYAIKVDAILTDKKNLYLFLLIADCLPVIFFDPVKEVVGLVHVGWKGVDLEIAAKATRRLENDYNTNPKDVIVGLGPAARKDSFIKENPSQVDDSEWQPFIDQLDANHYKVDFVGLCKKQIIDSGVLEKNIIDCYIDTVHDNRFFSHVRERELPLNHQGRFACVVGIRNQD